MAGGLENTFTEKLHAKADGQSAADGEIGNARLNHHRIVRAALEKGSTAYQGKDKSQQPDRAVEQKAVAGRIYCILQAAFSQALGQNGVKAYPQAGAEGYDHQLHRIGVGQSQKVQIADLSHIDAVHQVVDGTHEHGEHDGRGHGKHQLPHRHGAQDVVVLFHEISFLSFE